MNDNDRVLRSRMGDTLLDIKNKTTKIRNSNGSLIVKVPTQFKDSPGPFTINYCQNGRFYTKILRRQQEKKQFHEILWLDLWKFADEKQREKIEQFLCRFALRGRRLARACFLRIQKEKGGALCLSLKKC